MERSIWLYSGATTGWWCYDDNDNITINKMYSEYCKNQSKIKKEKKKTIPKHRIETKKNFEETSDLVDFCDIGDYYDVTNNDKKNKSYNSSLSYDDDLIKKFNIYVDENDKTNTININGSLYKIDFDKMLQINFEDIKKRRCIMCLTVSEKIFNNPFTLKKYLIDHKVKGVAGKLF